MLEKGIVTCIFPHQASLKCLGFVLSNSMSQKRNPRHGKGSQSQCVAYSSYTISAFGHSHTSGLHSEGIFSSLSTHKQHVSNTTALFSVKITLNVCAFGPIFRVL